MKHLTVRLLPALCRDHYIFSSCHCYHGKERKGRAPLHCSHFPMLPSHLAVAMETGRASMTAPCVRRAGRDGVMWFSPPPPAMVLALLSEARTFGTTDPLSGLTVARVEACALTSCHRGGKHLPQVFAKHQKLGANCLMSL